MWSNLKRLLKVICRQPVPPEVGCYYLNRAGNVVFVESPQIESCIMYLVVWTRPDEEVYYMVGKDGRYAYTDLDRHHWDLICKLG